MPVGQYEKSDIGIIGVPEREEKHSGIETLFEQYFG